jgi:carbon-monoxide dehydrogenase small subunit
MVELTVNGVRRTVDVEPRRLLSDALRESLNLTGTHVGCEHGVCGACTVLLDGEPVRSCLMLAVQAEGHSLETVESLASPDGSLHPLQRAFARHHALQCGFCTSGMLMTALPLVRANVTCSRDEMREHMSGVVCRCTGYQTIVDAVLDAAGAVDDE